MTSAQVTRAKALLAATVYENPYIPIEPTEKQALFLSLECEEALYGGAAGGGKTEAALMAAAQFLPVPGYHALIMRKTIPQLRQQGGLMERAASWWAGKGPEWNESKKTWTFRHPVGPPSTLTFGSMESDNDRFQYDGAEIDFIGLDELRHFNELPYVYMATRLRGKSAVPRRLRGFTNPGADWVRERYGIQRPCPENGNGRAMQAGPDGRMFVPAFLDENPHLLKNDPKYVEKLRKQDPVTRAQLESGDWWIQAGGNLFKFAGRNNVPADVGIRIVPAATFPPLEAFSAVMRFWDLAATEPTYDNPDPDWTRGQLWGYLSDGTYWLIDQLSAREGPDKVERLLSATAKSDLARIPDIGWVIEVEPGGEAKMWAQGIVARVIAPIIGHDACFLDKPSIDKVTRSLPFSGACSRGLVNIPLATWTDEYVRELSGFPNVKHDDQVDPGSATQTWLPFWASELRARARRASGELPEVVIPP